MQGERRNFCVYTWLLDCNRIFNSDGELAKLVRAYRDGKKISAFGLCGFAKAIAVSQLNDAKLLVVCSDFYTARIFYDNLTAITGGGVYLLPSRDETLVFRDAYSGETVIERLKTLGT